MRDSKHVNRVIVGLVCFLCVRGSNTLYVVERAGDLFESKCICKLRLRAATQIGGRRRGSSSYFNILRLRTRKRWYASTCNIEKQVQALATCSSFTRTHVDNEIGVRTASYEYPCAGGGVEPGAVSVKAFAFLQRSHDHAQLRRPQDQVVIAIHHLREHGMYHIGSHFHRPEWPKASSVEHARNDHGLRVFEHPVNRFLRRQRVLDIKLLLTHVLQLFRKTVCVQRVTPKLISAPWPQPNSIIPQSCLARGVGFQCRDQPSHRFGIRRRMSFANTVVRDLPSMIVQRSGQSTRLVLDRSNRQYECPREVIGIGRHVIALAIVCDTLQCPGSFPAEINDAGSSM